MEMIYFNNAASSFPKPNAAVEAVLEELRRPPVNPYRDHADLLSADDRCRRAIAALFNAPHQERIIFCSGATEAVNLALNGLVHNEMHVVTTPLEHNAVLRPLYHMEKLGRITLEIVPVDPLKPHVHEKVIEAIGPRTSMVVVNQASNVNGLVVDIEPIYEACHKRGLPLVIDASQSAGSISLNASAMPKAVIIFTGHKSLLGPAGTGGMVIGPDVELGLWKLGGTGIHSEYKSMPELMPLKYEPGTLNHPGLAGLAAAVEYIIEQGPENLARKKSDLSGYLVKNLEARPEVSLYTPGQRKNPCGIVSFNLEGWSPQEVGYILQESFGIRVRTGLNCAPLMNQALGVFPQGTVRISFSAENTCDEVEQLLAALSSIGSAT